MTNNLSKLAKFCCDRMPLSWRRQLVIGEFCSLAMLTTAHAQLELLYRSHAGTSPQNAIAQLKTGWVVAATCDSTANLKVITWQDTGAALMRRGSYLSTASCQNTVAITPFNSTTVVTADVNGGSVLEVAAWEVSSTGSISPLGTPATFDISANILQVSIAQLDATRVVSTSIDEFDDLNVSVWDVPSTGDITRKDNASLTGAYSAYTTITGLNSSQVVTATESGTTGDLEVTAWAVDSNSNISQQPGGATAGHVGRPQITKWNSGQVVTAFQNGTDDLELISWTVNSMGTVTRQYTGTGGPAMPAAICIMPSEGPFTVVLGGGSLLDVELWEKSGSKFTEFDTYDTKFEYLPTGCAPISTNRVVTSAYTNNVDHDLELDEWTLEFIP